MSKKLTEEELHDRCTDVLDFMIENAKSLTHTLKVKDISKTLFYKWVDFDELNKKIYLKAKSNENYIEAIRCKSNPKGSKASDLSDYRILNAKKSNREKFPIGSVYLLEMIGTGFFKIGVSKNLSRRFRDLSSASPFEIKILENKKFNNAYDLEEVLHKEFSDKYIKSEWFKLSIEDLNKYKQIIDSWED